jgi:phosphatidylglycerophosphatase A
MKNPKDNLRLSNPWHLLATGFGSGLFPVMPGTMGTLAAIIPYLLIAHLPLWAYILVCIFSAWVGVIICQKASDDMGVHDHGSIVWDEFVGLWITMIIVPIAGLNVYDWKWLITGFLLFRFFDMVKPWPIGWFDKRIHGGLGIMLDDIVAGAMSAVCLILFGYYYHWL